MLDWIGQNPQKAFRDIFVFLGALDFMRDVQI